MKKSSVLIIAAALILSSCSALTQIASSDNGHRFQDGIYNNTPAFRSKEEKIESQAETQALAQKTRESQIYLFGDKKDTVAIPQDMSAIIRYDQKLGGTVVTVGENPYDWRFDLENNYGYYYGPYSLGSSWYWSRHYSPFYALDFAPWRYRGWYDGWYYGGWYSPYYYGGFYGGWYDPWYWGSHWGWYDPWYSPYYCGWYGGWDPYWGHHHHHGHGPGHIGNADHHKDVWYGSRHRTGSERVFGNGSSLRGGIGSRSTVSRNSSTASRIQASAGISPRRTTNGRTSASNVQPAVSRSSVVRTAPSSREIKASARNQQNAINGTVERDVVTVGRQVSPSGRVTPVTQQNYRRPAAVTSPSGAVTRESSSSTPSYNRTASASERSSSYDRSTSRSSTNTSSYNRNSSSYSPSRSSFSSGGSSSFSRSSSGGGFSGGSNRSTGSSGSRR